MKLADTLRNLLIELGLPESHTAEDEGFAIAAEGRNEVSVQFNGIGRNGASTRREQTRRHAAALLELCSALSERRLALTLFLSPRNLALFVRADEQ